MSAALPFPPSRAHSLTDADLRMFADSYITPELAAQAQIRRVSALEGADVLGRKAGPDYAGIVFLYIRPGEIHAHLERLRIDSPPIEMKNGQSKAAYKYLTAAGRGNAMYVTPGTDPALLQNASVPIILCEGEKKTLALHRASYESLPEGAELPLFLPIGFPGVQSWRGKTGREQDARGAWVDVRGPIPDLDRVKWTDRRVTILFDSNVATNRNVFFARLNLAKELQSRGAQIHLADLPQEEGINGPDDFLAKYGLEPTLAVIAAAQVFKPNDQLAELDYSDFGNEQAFALLYGTDFLFNGTAGEWLRWDRNLWVPDDRGAADRAMLEVASARLQSISAVAEDPSGYEKTGDARKSHKRAYREAVRLRNVRGRQSALLSATTNPKFARRAEDFDQNPLLLGCPNGVGELQTGTLRPGRREDMLTMSTNVNWITGATCPKWLRFLSEVFPDRPQMIDYLRRVIGYSLTGLTREECFWILHGSGRNGKGTLLLVLSELFGKYGATAEFSALADRKSSGGPRNDVAALAGKRFVTAQESREGCQLDEPLIKSLTGGDLITARFLHKEFFTFRPTWKIFLATNHRPEIRGTDTGIWSRPRLIPFTVSFEGREDKGLKQRLLDPMELAGILQWAVQGCREYLEHGLDAPAEVVAATAEYRSDSDLIGRFVDECCVTGQYARVRARQLYQAFAQWSDEAGEKGVLTETAFGRRMVERGVAKEHTRTGSFYLGIGVRNGQSE